MKGYGLPRNHDVGSPDAVDIHYYGLKSAAGSVRGKGGDFHGYIRNKEAKQNTRRIYKKSQRHAEKMMIRKELEDLI